MLPVFRQGHVSPFQAPLRHQTTMLHSKGQDRLFSAPNVCLKDKPRQDLLNFGMLYVARLILEAWVFTSVQSIKNPQKPNKNQPKTPAPDIFPCQNNVFLTQCCAGGVTTLRINPGTAAIPNKKQFATTAGHLCAV